MHDDAILAMWGLYDSISADLVRAKRAAREGRGTEAEVDRLRMELLDLGIDLAAQGELADPTEPGGSPAL